MKEGDLIRSQIAYGQQTLIRLENGRMHMGFLLSGFIGTGTLILDRLRGGSQRAVGLDRQRGIISAAIVGDDSPFPAAVDADITGIVTAAGLFVDERELTGG